MEMEEGKKGSSHMAGMKGHLREHKRNHDCHDNAGEKV